MARFLVAYELQDITMYRSLFTSDFRYAFSAAADSALLARYGNGWGKGDETASALHMLTGFTNAAGTYVPPASAIVITFVNDQYGPDPAHADSVRFYDSTPVALVNLAVDVPDTSGSGTTYAIAAPHAFHLVRGDAAVLDAGQPADSLHWYIRGWNDLATAPGAAAGSHAVPTTWGRLKVRYAP